MIGKTTQVTKSLAAAGNYTAGDVLSESASAGTAWIFSGMPGSGYITKIHALLETTNLTPRLGIFWFKATPTCNLNDNVANTAVVHADAANYLGYTQLPALQTIPTTGGGDSEATATPNTIASNLPLAFDSDPDGKIYAVVVILDAETGETATDDLIIEITVEP